jgi:hypothetical protein
MQLQAAPGSLVTLFLFGDEDDAYGRCLCVCERARMSLYEYMHVFLFGDRG